MKVREIHVRKGIGGYHATAVTDQNSTVTHPDGEAETGRRDLSTHSDDLKTAILTLKNRMKKSKADWRRARIISDLGHVGQAAIKQALEESSGDTDKPVTWKDFMGLFN